MFNTFPFILLFIFCLNASITFGQNEETSIDSLLQKGNKFYTESNFTKAKEYYINVLEKDSSNIDATFNLAACELGLDHKTEACIQFNNAYYLGADDARPIIKEYCGAIAYRNVMYSGDVDTVPTFQLENESLPLLLIPENFDGRFSPMELNPKFLKLIRAVLKQEKGLKSINETIYIVFKFGREEVFKIEEFKGKLNPAQQDKINKIFNKTVILTPAYYQNKPVGLYRRMSLPLKF